MLSFPHVSPVSISLSLPFLIPHTHTRLSSSSSSSFDVLPLHHQCLVERISSTETSRHGMSGVSPICNTVSVLLSIPAVLSLPHVSSPVSISLSLPFLIPHTHLSSSSSSSLDVLPLHHQCFNLRNGSTETSRHGMSRGSPIWKAVSVLLSIHVLSSSCLLRLSLSFPFLIPHSHSSLLLLLSRCPLLSVLLCV